VRELASAQAGEQARRWESGAPRRTSGHPESGRAHRERKAGARARECTGGRAGAQARAQTGRRAGGKRRARKGKGDGRGSCGTRDERDKCDVTSRESPFVLNVDLGLRVCLHASLIHRYRPRFMHAHVKASRVGQPLYSCATGASHPINIRPAPEIRSANNLVPSME
jgi:hypothetical protein